MNKSATLVIGIILVLLGILFIGPSLGLFSLQNMWPAILLLLGVGFFIGYFAARQAIGLLMPAAILTVSSIPFFICTFTGEWYRMAYLWPFFPISVSLGFFLMYFLGTRERGLLIPASILLAIGAVSFLILNYITMVLPFVFLVAGLTLIFIGLLGRKRKSQSAAPSSETSKMKSDEG